MLENVKYIGKFWKHVKVAIQCDIDVFRIRVKLVVFCLLNFFLRITRLAYLFDSQATREYLKWSTTLFDKHNDLCFRKGLFCKKAFLGVCGPLSGRLWASLGVSTRLSGRSERRGQVVFWSTTCS